jgi:uncharacterized protein (TIGR02588 family)
MTQGNQSSSPGQGQRSLAEWTTFGIATAVVAAIAGLVIFDWRTSNEQPPVLTLQQSETIRSVNGQFYLPFTVANSGGETVESVQIVAELQLKGQEETGEQQIDFLSAGETAEGAFIFSQDPQQGDLRLRVASYKLP